MRMNVAELTERSLGARSVLLPTKRLAHAQHDLKVSALRLFNSSKTASVSKVYSSILCGS